jgi:Protein of unknown function (DUF3276)
VSFVQSRIKVDKWEAFHPKIFQPVKNGCFVLKNFYFCKYKSINQSRGGSTVDNQRNEKSEVFSNKIKAGKRTYFFDVKATRSNDYYITITESKRRFDGEGYEKHKIFLYKEDFYKFLKSLNDTVDHVKHELMPDFDYDGFDRRNEGSEESGEGSTTETSDTSW